MTPRKVLTAFRMDPEMLAALEAVKARDGIPVAEQVRRAVSTWLDDKRVTAKPERKRAGTRRRS